MSISFDILVIWFANILNNESYGVETSYPSWKSAALVSLLFKNFGELVFSKYDVVEFSVVEYLVFSVMTDQPRLHVH